MSAAASTEPAFRLAPPGTALEDLKPGEYLACGSIAPGYLEALLKRLRAKVLSPVCAKIAEDTYAELDAVSNLKRDAYHTYTKTYTHADPTDQEWAIKFFGKIEQRVNDCENTKWEIRDLLVRYINGSIVVKYTIVDREDPLPDICEWIGDLINESEEAIADITDICAEAEGWPAEAERLVEEAEVRASGTTVNA